MVWMVGCLDLWIFWLNWVSFGKFVLTKGILRGFLGTEKLNGNFFVIKNEKYYLNLFQNSHKSSKKYQKKSAHVLNNPLKTIKHTQKTHQTSRSAESIQTSKKSSWFVLSRNKYSKISHLKKIQKYFSPK